jgi:membrane peptidoglycan carboxypeptidase
MKPYVLATALEEGKSLSSRYPGQDDQKICGQQVHNDSGETFGSIDLVTGLEHSVNTVYYRLACDVGPKKIVALMRKVGLDNVKDKLDGEGSLTPQIALGSGGYDIRPIDQAEGYATFAANGIHARTHFVEQVCDLSRKHCTSAGIRRDRAIPADVSADTTKAMAAVVAGGTGTNAQLPGRNVAGKTGTTTNNTNAWFCGFTPNQLATVVWLAKKGGGTLQSGGSGVYGGTLPAEIFHDFMQTALEGKPVTPFPTPGNVGTPSTPSGAPPTTVTVTSTPSATPSAVVTVTRPPVVPTSPPPVVPTPPPSTAPPEPTSSPTPPQASQAASPAASP